MVKMKHEGHLITPPKKRQFSQLLLVLCILFQSSGSFAVEPPHLIFQAPERFMPFVKRIKSMEGPYYGHALELAGLAHPGPPIQIHLVSENFGVRSQLPMWVSGYALGKHSVVVLLPERVHSYPAHGIEDLVVHEVSHILNYRATRGGVIPRWFDEGIATIAARTWGFEDQARLIWAVGNPDHFSLERLNNLFNGNALEARRGYSLSAGFVRDLIQEHGPTVSGRILSLVGQGAHFETAFYEIVKLSPHEAAMAFLDRQSLWIRWVPFFTSNFSIWMGMAVLAIIVFIVHIRKTRSRRYYDNDVEDEFDYGELEQSTEWEWDDEKK